MDWPSLSILMIKSDEVGVKAFAAQMPNILRQAGFKGIVLEILASYCSGLDVVYQNLDCRHLIS